MAVVLFDNTFCKQLYPITLNKAVAQICVGALSIQQRWQKISNQKVFVFTQNYLQALYNAVNECYLPHNIWIDATILPTNDLVNKILNLQLGEALFDEHGLIAGVFAQTNFDITRSNLQEYFTRVEYLPQVTRFFLPQDLVKLNAQFIQFDIDLLTANNCTPNIDASNFITNPSNIFIEEGATVKHCFLNATDGPIYIAKDVLIMEGSMIRGPFVACQNAVIKMGSKIYGATTVGKNCTVGGEIKNCIISSYTNKAHDGYLGDSFVGEWCNLGAGTTNSNVKNNASEIKVYNQYLQTYNASGNKCGFVMGDYCTTAINTTINSGTTIGICCNIFENGLLPKSILNFSWGAMGSTKYTLDKAIVNINNWKSFKQKTFTESEVQILQHIYKQLNNI